MGAMSWREGEDRNETAVSQGVRFLTASLNPQVEAVDSIWCHHFTDLETETQPVNMLRLRPQS